MPGWRWATHALAAARPAAWGPTATLIGWTTGTGRPGSPLRAAPAGRRPARPWRERARSILGANRCAFSTHSPVRIPPTERRPVRKPPRRPVKTVDTLRDQTLGGSMGFRHDD